MCQSAYISFHLAIFIGDDNVLKVCYIFKGLRAIHSPNTGIIDWGLVTKFYGKEFEKRGGTIYTKYEVSQFDTQKESFEGNKDGLEYPVQLHGKSSEVCHSTTSNLVGNMCLSY